MKYKERLQYVLTLVLTLFAMIAIVYYSFGSFYSIVKQDVVRIGERTIVETSEKLNNYLVKGMDVLQVTGLVVDYMLQEGASSEEIEGFLLQESERYMEDIDEHFTGIYGVFDGVYIDGIGWVPDDDYVPEERVWYTTAMEAGGSPVIVAPYLDAQTNSIMISVSQLLTDGKSVVSLDIVLDVVQELAQDIRMDDKGYGFVVDKEGLVVAHSDESQKGKNYMISDNSSYGDEVKQLVETVYQSDGKSFKMELGGEKCTVFSDNVQNDWYVVMIINNSDLFKQVRITLFRNMLLSVFIFGIVAYFCTTSYYNRKKATMYAEELKQYQRTLEERVHEQTRKIQEQAAQYAKMQYNVIEGMATLIESRDGNTGMHVENTKKYVGMIVNYMYENRIFPEEVTKQFVQNICSVAVLHDVGKIKIPDTILNKPGKFTREEFEIMKTHSAIGGEIISEIMGEDVDEELVEISKDIATYHHEKWDGTGYPEGLSGRDIPLCARIMAVADVFDALVSKRVYKEGISSDEAYNILKRDEGSHFDPVIVEVFFAIREEVELYLKENASE